MIAIISRGTSSRARRGHIQPGADLNLGARGLTYTAPASDRPEQSARGLTTTAANEAALMSKQSARPTTRRTAAECRDRRCARCSLVTKLSVTAFWTSGRDTKLRDQRRGGGRIVEDVDEPEGHRQQEDDPHLDGVGSDQYPEDERQHTGERLRHIQYAALVQAVGNPARPTARTGRSARTELRSRGPGQCRNPSAAGRGRTAPRSASRCR